MMRLHFDCVGGEAREGGPEFPGRGERSQAGAVDPAHRTLGFFEAISGLTATGSKGIVGLDALPTGILVRRTIPQWIGGIGIIVTGIGIRPFLRVGGMQLFHTEKAEKELGDTARFAIATLWIYLALTFACALSSEIFWMHGFDAILHAMTTVSTGGLGTYDASTDHFPQPGIQCTVTLFMLSGSIPFVWYLRVVRKGAWRSEQVGVHLASLAVIVLFVAGWLIWHDFALPEPALRMAALNVASVVTITGLATADYTMWGRRRLRYS